MGCLVFSKSSWRAQSRQPAEDVQTALRRCYTCLSRLAELHHSCRHWSCPQVSSRVATINKLRKYTLLGQAHDVKFKLDFHDDCFHLLPCFHSVLRVILHALERGRTKCLPAADLHVWQASQPRFTKFTKAVTDLEAFDRKWHDGVFAQARSNDDG